MRRGIIGFTGQAPTAEQHQEPQAAEDPSRSYAINGMDARRPWTAGLKGYTGHQLPENLQGRHRVPTVSVNRTTIDIMDSTKLSTLLLTDMHCWQCICAWLVIPQLALHAGRASPCTSCPSCVSNAKDISPVTRTDALDLEGLCYDADAQVRSIRRTSRTYAKATFSTCI
jgi:hypothetical protein